MFQESTDKWIEWEKQMLRSVLTAVVLLGNCQGRSMHTLKFLWWNSILAYFVQTFLLSESGGVSSHRIQLLIYSSKFKCFDGAIFQPFDETILYDVAIHLRCGRDCSGFSLISRESNRNCDRVRFLYEFFLRLEPKIVLKCCSEQMIFSIIIIYNPILQSQTFHTVVPSGR